MQFVLSILFCLFFQFFPRTIPVPSYSFCWQRWVVVVVVMENFSFEIIFFLFIFILFFFYQKKSYIEKKQKKAKRKSFSTCTDLNIYQLITNYSIFFCSLTCKFDSESLTIIIIFLLTVCMCVCVYEWPLGSMLMMMKLF